MSYIVDPRLEADPRGMHYLQEVAPYLSSETDTMSRPTRLRGLPPGRISAGQSIAALAPAT
jgi:hypothetical protein